MNGKREKEIDLKRICQEDKFDLLKYGCIGNNYRKKKILAESFKKISQLSFYKKALL